MSSNVVGRLGFFKGRFCPFFTGLPVSMNTSTSYVAMIAITMFTSGFNAARSQTHITGMEVFDTDSSGNRLNNLYWNTIPGDTVPNAWVRGGGSGYNGPSDSQAPIFIDPFSSRFHEGSDADLFVSNDFTFTPQYIGLSLFFNGATSPQISVFGSTPGFAHLPRPGFSDTFTDGMLTLKIGTPGSGSLSWHAPPTMSDDVAGPFSEGANGVNDASLFVHITVRVSVPRNPQAHPLEYWTQVDPGVTNSSPDLNAVRYANGQWVVVGSGGTILLSTNGTNWAPQDSGTTANFSDVGYGSGQWIAVGSSAIAHSADGVGWTSDSGTNLAALAHLSYGNGQWLATGPNYFDGRGTIYGSKDGSHWTRHYVSPTAAAFGRPQYGNGRWMVPSMDGAHNVGYFAGVVIPEDGTNWISRHPPYDGWTAFYSIAYDGKRWIAGGERPSLMFGYMASSSDGGSTWQPVKAPRFSTRALSWGGGVWVATLNYHGGIAFSSGPDKYEGNGFSSGENWVENLEPAPSFGPARLLDVAYGDGYWVAVGFSGRIFFAGPVVSFHSPENSGNGQTTWQMSGPAGKPYRIQTSTNLIDWADLMSFTSTNETTPFTVSSTNKHHFYRSVSP